MSFSLLYLTSRFFFRLSDFFHHWYIHGSRNLAHGFVSLLERIDRVIAFRVTLRHFGEPLYKDYTFMGRIFGVIFRTIRLGLGALVYTALGICFGVVYLLWITLPFIALLAAYRDFRIHAL